MTNSHTERAECATDAAMPFASPPTASQPSSASSSIEPASPPELTTKKSEPIAQPTVLPIKMTDIEHTPLPDGNDPRGWSPARKWAIVGMLSAGSFIPAASANIIFPALAAVEQDLNTTSSVVALSVSIFILVQGSGSITFVPISELYGRKYIYFCCLLAFTLTQIGASRADSIGLFIAMRVIAGYSSSPLLTLAAGTIADLYEVEERGKKMGLYYAAPLLGPSLGTLFGGALTQAGSWRIVFYFMAACGGAILITFLLFFKETFRKERSLVWQKAKKRAIMEAAADAAASASGTQKHSHHRFHMPHFASRKHEPPQAAAAAATKVIDKANIPLEAPVYHAPPDLEAQSGKGGKGAVLGKIPDTTLISSWTGGNYHLDGNVALSALEEHHQLHHDSIARVYHSSPNHTAGISSCSCNDLPGTAQEPNDSESAMPALTLARSAPGAVLLDSVPAPVLTRARGDGGQKLDRVITADGREIPIRVRASDINPLKPMWEILRQRHNIIILTFSGLTFASQYSLSYTATRTFAAAPYHFEPLVVGLILFSLGAGGMIGSILGGRATDARLRKLREASIDGRPTASEERLMTVRLACFATPIFFIAYAWMTAYKVQIAGPVVILFFLGLVQFGAYSAVLSYLVDSNQGRAGAAVSCNSVFRGSVACVASQISGPLQNRMGDGWFMTGWGLVLAAAQLLLFIVAYKGTEWRAADAEKAAEKRKSEN